MKLGPKAEQWLHSRLLGRDVQVLEQNYRCRLGEIDLILAQRQTLIFVEIRCRQTPAQAKASVTAHKQRRLIQAARHYLANHAWDGDCRFDVAALSPKGATFHCEWVADAFTMDGC